MRAWMMNVSEWMYEGCERVDVCECEDCDEVRVLDEGMDEVNVNVSEWMYGGIVMR